jgi:hydrogenase nickel incorporation protein HypA/HybF
MHEFGLCEGVLDAVRARARGREVAAITVRFGVRHAVNAQSLSLAFETVAAGTEAADAAVDLVTVPAQLTCRSCGARTDSLDLLAVCPRCESTDVELAGGDEMTLESVTYLPESTAGDAT